MAIEDVGEGIGGTRPRPNLMSWARELAEARWPRIIRVALATAIVVTALAALVSSGRDDEFLRGDLSSLAFGIVVTIVLASGIDERMPPAARTIARMFAIVAVGYMLSTVWVVVAALVATPA